MSPPPCGVALGGEVPGLRRFPPPGVYHSVFRRRNSSLLCFVLWVVTKQPPERTATGLLGHHLQRSRKVWLWLGVCRHVRRPGGCRSVRSKARTFGACTVLFCFVGCCRATSGLTSRAVGRERAWAHGVYGMEAIASTVGI